MTIVAFIICYDVKKRRKDDGKRASAGRTIGANDAGRTGKTVGPSDAGRNAGVMCARGDRSSPVSYTHLDVYKRQAETVCIHL